MEQEPHKLPLRFYEIDMLRFLAAFSVVLYHYCYVGFNMMHLSPVRYPALEPLTKYGYLGVELFFVISGYVVLMSAYKKSIQQFFLSRVTRLYPAYWVACTLCFLVVYFFGPKPGNLAWSDIMHVSVKEWAVNMTMFQEFVGSSNLDGPYWTLTKELTFYFLISLMLAYGLFSNLDIVLTLWLVYTAVTGPTPAVHSPFFYLLMPDYSAFFIAGMLFYLLQNKLLDRWKVYALLALSFLLCLRSARAEAATYASIFHQPFSMVIIALVLVAIFVVFWLIITRTLDLQRYRWLSWLGALTYPLYLLHSNIGFVVLQRFSQVNPYVLLVCLLSLMLVAAFLLHVGVEKKLSRPLGQQLHKVFSHLSR